MSDKGFSGAVVCPDAAGQTFELTAGSMMRNAREAAGLHIAALAVSMKIPVKKLEALESDRLDLLHDAVFVRALASSVCRTLKLDPAPVLAKLPVNATPKLSSDERGINTPFHTGGNNRSQSVRTMLTRPSVLLVIALLLGGLVVYFMPDIKFAESNLEVAGEQPKPLDRVDTFPTQPPTAAVNVTSAQLPSGTNSETSVAQPSSEQPIKPSPVQKDAPLASPVGIANDTNKIANSPPVSAVGLLVFKAKAASWVKVVDFKGIVQLSKTMAEGEVIGVSGEAPLSVVVGRSDAMDIEVRGKPFSLVAVTKENVARFEVK